MNPTLIGEIETMFLAPPAPAKPRYEKPLAVAAGMLSRAAPHQMSGTTVVGVLGSDDAAAFRALVSEIGEQYGLESTVRMQPGAYSVRFNRPSLQALSH